MIITEEFWQQILQDALEFDKRYIEVPDPDNPEDTIVVYKGFEDIIYD